MARHPDMSSELALPSAVTFDEVSGLLRDWLPAVRAADCRLDWAAVRRVDSAALALALELSREAGQHGHSLQHLHLPVEVESLIDLYGLQAFIAAA